MGSPSPPGSFEAWGAGEDAPDMADWPPVERPGIKAYAARQGLYGRTRDFVISLARDGVASIDLGDTARRLCDRAAADVEPWFRAAPGAGRVQDAWLRSKAVRELAAWPEVARLLRAAYGRRPFPFQTLNFRQGTAQDLHADALHFHSRPERFMCGVWIALEDVRPDAGPVVYHPGSHRLPVMTLQDAGVVDEALGPEAYQSVFVKAFAQRIAASGLPAAQAVIPKGWAFVWAANLAHGGAPVRSPVSTRRSLVVHWYFDDCLYHTPMLSGAQGLALRLPTDIGTGRWVWPRRDGRRVYPGHRVVLGALRRRLLRRPSVL